MASYSGFSHKKMMIFHSYVSLPEGKGFGDVDHFLFDTTGFLMIRVY